jgi:hypothetical protein
MSRIWGLKSVSVGNSNRGAVLYRKKIYEDGMVLQTRLKFTTQPKDYFIQSYYFT